MDKVSGIQKWSQSGSALKPLFSLTAIRWWYLWLQKHFQSYRISQWVCRFTVRPMPPHYVRFLANKMATTEMLILRIQTGLHKCALTQLLWFVFEVVDEFWQMGSLAPAVSTAVGNSIFNILVNWPKAKWTLMEIKIKVCTFKIPVKI